MSSFTIIKTSLIFLEKLQKFMTSAKNNALLFLFSAKIVLRKD